MDETKAERQLRRLTTVLGALLEYAERLEKELGRMPSLSVMAARGELGLDPDRAPAPSQPTPEARVELEALQDALREARGAIDRDRTGLALALNRISAVVAGYSWLADGEWGSYCWEQRTEKILREEIGRAFEAIREIRARALDESGKLATNTVLAIDAALARRSAPTPGYREGWEAGREAAALLFVEDAERFRAEADRALAMDLTVLAKMHMGDAAECLREAGRIRALPLPESALLTKDAKEGVAPARCGRCKGSGWAPGCDADSRWPHNYACRECKGTGGVPGLQPLPEHLIEPAAPAPVETPWTCPDCCVRPCACLKGTGNPAPVETREAPKVKP